MNDTQMNDDMNEMRRDNIESVVEAAPIAHDAPSDVFSSTVTDTIVHDLHDLLTRDVQIGHFIYETTSGILPLVKDTLTALEPLAKYDFPDALFDNSPIIRTKLQHFQIFKADIILTLRINSNPFQSGGIIPIYTPYVNGISAERDEGSQFLASMTSNLSELVSLEDPNTFEMRIPYANVMDYFNMRDESHQFGTVQMWPASPLRSLDPADSVSITVFARFDAPKALVATAVNSLTAVSRRHFLKTLTAEECRYRLAQAQGAEGDTTGPVSKIAGMVGSVASSLTGIPYVGKIAAPVSWAARAVSGVASVFGFSKDTNNNSVTYVNPIFGRFQENTDGQDNSRMLAMTADNRIDSSKLVVDPEDEMCFNKIKKRLAYVYQWQTKSPLLKANQLIGSMPVTPLWPNPDSETQFTGHYFSAFQYVVSNFRFWNGTMEYYLTILKTKLCSGRLVLVYIPHGAAPATLGDLINTNQHKIIDLNPKDGTKVMHVPFSVPYVREKPWLRTDMAIAGKNTTGSGSGGEYNGSIALYVMNSVIFPPTIDDGLDFLLAMRGGDDFSVAVPEPHFMPSYRTATAQIFETSNLPTMESMFASPGMIDMEEKYTMGEVFVSLRALIKRFNPTLISNNGDQHVYSPTKFFLDTTNRHTRRTDFDRIKSDQSIETVGLSLQPTWFWLSSFIYRFWAGSTRLKLASIDGARVEYSLANVIEGPKNAQEKIVGDNEYCHTCLDPTGVHHFSTNPMLEVSLPFYSDRSGRVVASTNGDVNSTNTGLRFGFQKDNISWVLSEAAGDDFSFWFLTGPPRCVRIADLYVGNDFFVNKPAGGSGIDVNVTNTVSTLPTNTSDTPLYVSSVDVDPPVALPVEYPTILCVYKPNTTLYSVAEFIGRTICPTQPYWPLIQVGDSNGPRIRIRVFNGSNNAFIGRYDSEYTVYNDTANDTPNWWKWQRLRAIDSAPALDDGATYIVCNDSIPFTR